jgi:hypothetical protein
MQVDAFGGGALEPALALTLTFANNDVQNVVPADLSSECEHKDRVKNRENMNIPYHWERINHIKVISL